jgi:hypothetical protein
MGSFILKSFIARRMRLLVRRRSLKARRSFLVRSWIVRRGSLMISFIVRTGTYSSKTLDTDGEKETLDGDAEA